MSVTTESANYVESWFSVGNERTRVSVIRLCAMHRISIYCPFDDSEVPKGEQVRV